MICMRGLISSIMLIFFAGCAADDELRQFFSENYNLENIYDKDILIVINEHGDCLNCNSNFSKLVAKYRDDEQVVYLISTPGSKVDISFYMDYDSKNIYFDFFDKFSEISNLQSSAVYFLGENKTEDIVEINPNNIQELITRIDQK